MEQVWAMVVANIHEQWVDPNAIKADVPRALVELLFTGHPYILEEQPPRDLLPFWARAAAVFALKWGPLPRRRGTWAAGNCVFFFVRLPSRDSNTP